MKNSFIYLIFKFEYDINFIYSISENNIENFQKYYITFEKKSIKQKQEIKLNDFLKKKIDFYTYENINIINIDTEDVTKNGLKLLKDFEGSYLLIDLNNYKKLIYVNNDSFKYETTFTIEIFEKTFKTGNIYIKDIECFSENVFYYFIKNLSSFERYNKNIRWKNIIFSECFLKNVDDDTEYLDNVEKLIKSFIKTNIITINNFNSEKFSILQKHRELLIKVLKTQKNICFFEQPKYLLEPISNSTFNAFHQI